MARLLHIIIDWRPRNSQVPNKSSGDSIRRCLVQQPACILSRSKRGSVANFLHIIVDWRPRNCQVPKGSSGDDIRHCHLQWPSWISV